MQTTDYGVAAPLPQRPLSLRCTPIAQAERLALYSHAKFGLSGAALLKELIAWREREKVPLEDALLSAIARHIAPGTPRPVHPATPKERALRLWSQRHTKTACARAAQMSVEDFNRLLKEVGPVERCAHPAGVQYWLHSMAASLSVGASSLRATLPFIDCDMGEIVHLREAHAAWCEAFALLEHLCTTDNDAPAEDVHGGLPSEVGA